MESGSESSNSEEFDLEYEMEAQDGSECELKYFDTALAFNCDSTGEVVATGQLCLVPQGATASTRIGRVINVRSVWIRGDILFSPGTSTAGSTNISIYLVLDRQCNGAAASATDVFTSVIFTRAMPNLENTDRFKILGKWIYALNTRAGVKGDFATVVRHFEKRIECNIPIEYSGATGALTEIRSNNLFLMASCYLSDDSTAFNGNARIRFNN